MHFPAKWVPLLGALVLPTIARAADFPSQLWGRSIVVSWNTNGEDRPAAVGFISQLTVYVSGAGRTFGRMAVGGARSARSEQGPISRTVSTAVNAYFENGTLLADTQTINGALHVAIIFDATYGRCNASVVFGGDEGAPVGGRDIKASSCSITNGNALVGR